mmetsp:Transcript_60826/g.143227  ORF Transcript_60826/g.143227 Transcript_60826/m.143227 type:complete len:213 (+) Transcript_60826:865-1503(+)
MEALGPHDQGRSGGQDGVAARGGQHAGRGGAAPGRGEREARVRGGEARDKGRGRSWAACAHARRALARRGIQGREGDHAQAREGAQREAARLGPRRRARSSQGGGCARAETRGGGLQNGGGASRCLFACRAPRLFARGQRQRAPCGGEAGRRGAVRAEEVLQPEAHDPGATRAPALVPQEEDGPHGARTAPLDAERAQRASSAEGGGGDGAA